MRADYGSYVVTIYKTTKLYDTEIKEKKKKKEKDGKANLKYI